MEHQDWEPVTLGRRSAKPKVAGPLGAAACGGRRTANRSMFGHGMLGTNATNARRLADSTDAVKRETVSLPVSKAIQQGRTGAGMTQKQLAQRLNVKAAVVQAYESGKAVPSGRIIQRMESALGLEYGAISGKKRKARKKKPAP